MKTIAVTGAGGFIGSYLVRELARRDYKVVAIDNFLRGVAGRLENLGDNVKIAKADIRNENEVLDALEGCDAVFHLAAINGTENFYNHPDLVLEVGVVGMINIARACIELNIPDLVIASSAEVYQTPSVVPTSEDIPLVLPNSLNPRYSYGGSKIISELIAFNYCRNKLEKVQAFRPHNVYGPDMGYKHVIPQLVDKISKAEGVEERTITIQGDGSETRAFCYVDDIVDGIILMWEKGETMNVYHIGSMEEVSIKELTEEVAGAYGVNLNILNGQLQEGGTPRRCPNIAKMAQLGYNPKVSLKEGLKRTVEWYKNNAKTSDNELL